MSVAPAALPAVTRPTSTPVAPTEAATLGRLVAEVHEALGSAIALRGTTTPSRRSALAEAEAYTHLVHGLGVLWSALWRGAPEPPELQQLGRLLAVNAAPRVAESPSTALTVALATATMAARSAADLLATHRDQVGGWRSPESVVLGDVQKLRGAAGVVAALAGLAVMLRGTIMSRMRDCGAGRRVSERLLPGGPDLALAAARCARATPALSDELASLQVARPSVREDKRSESQLHDRWRRLRRHAWGLSSAPTVSVTTLADLAALACAINSGARRVGAPQHRTTTWTALRTQLAELRTTTLRSTSVRHDVVAIGALLAGSPPESTSPFVERAVEGLPQLARWCRAGFARTWSDDVIYVRAAGLTGTEVTDHPELVEAKLRGRLVVAPATRLLVVRALYDDACLP